jgi:predicted dehydrogenase
MMQAMNAQEAREMLKASQQKPNLVTQVVPSPITFTWDATIQGIIQEEKLGDLIYVEVHQDTYTHM